VRPDRRSVDRASGLNQRQLTWRERGASTARVSKRLLHRVLLGEPAAADTARPCQLTFAEPPLSQRTEDSSVSRAINPTLAEADLSASAFDDVEFEDCDLSSVRLTGVSLGEVRFRRCKLLGVDWSSVSQSLIGNPLLFEACQLDYGVFQNMQLRRSVFRDCSAREIDLVGADIGEATFAGTNLERARFGATRLVETDLVGARGYELDPRENDVRGLRVGLPEGAALLRVFGIVVDA
jgi:fluoroquinolone resistance protein